MNRLVNLNSEREEGQGRDATWHVGGEEKGGGWGKEGPRAGRKAWGGLSSTQSMTLTWGRNGKGCCCRGMNEINWVTWWSKEGKGPQGAKQNSICRGHSATWGGLGVFPGLPCATDLLWTGERWRWSEMDVRGSWKLRVQQHKQATLVVLVRRQKSVWQGCKEEGMER